MPSVIKRPPVQKAILVQSVIVVLLVTITSLWNNQIAYNILYGAFIYIIPSFYFAWHSFRYIGAAKTKQIAQSMYKGQVGKFFLTVVMFAVLFKWIKLEQVWIVFLSYAINTVVNILITLIIVKRTKNILN